MTMRKGGLGRGLDSLIINTDVSVDNVSGDREIDGLIRISLNDIKRNENQPRKVFNEEKIDELAESIREPGVIKPIIVTKSLREREDGGLRERRDLQKFQRL